VDLPKMKFFDVVTCL
jgi:hypothetical protein